MGMGDVKLAGVMGLFLGRAVGPGDARRAARRLARRASSSMARHGAQGAASRSGRSSPLGGLVGLFAGDAIVDWYLDTFA